MSIDEMVALVKENLNITDKDLIIKDVIQDVLNYCNIIDLPEQAEPYIRNKVKSIINYESKYSAAVFDIKSISEGDTSITYSGSREDIYGLTAEDKRKLQSFRRVCR